MEVLILGVILWYMYTCTWFLLLLAVSCRVYRVKYGHFPNSFHAVESALQYVLSNSMTSETQSL